MATRTLRIQVLRGQVDGQDLVRLELQAVAGAPLAPEAAFVLDRSGSMADGKLEEAKAAVRYLLSAFPEAGRLALVAYDDEVLVGGFSREEATRFLEELEARGTTALHAGWKTGVELLKDEARPRFVFLLSDGLANVGLRHPEALAEESRRAADKGVYTFTLGFGEGYDRRLMASMALSGGGTHLYVAQGELKEGLEGELALLKGPVNLGAKVRLGEEVRHLAPFAPGERRVLLLPVADAKEVEVIERAPGGKVRQRHPLPSPALEGTEAWRKVELEALVQEGAKALAQEIRSREEAEALRERVQGLLERLEGHSLRDEPRVKALLDALTAFAELLVRLAKRYDAEVSDRVAREGAAYSSLLFSEERASRRGYRRRD